MIILFGLAGHATDLQRAILFEALEAFTSLETSGSVKTLPFKWDDDETWKEVEKTKGDDRIERYDTPQYQYEADRKLAEAKLNTQ